MRFSSNVTRPTAADWRHFVPIFVVVFGVEVGVRIALRSWPPLSVFAEEAVAALVLTIVAGPLFWLIVARRIAGSTETEKFRADARVANILATSIDGIITTDAAGVVTHFNVGAEKIFAYPASEIIGRNISLLVPEHFHSAHERHVDRFATGAKSSRGMGGILATEGRRKSGEQFPVDVSISRLAVDGRVMLTAVVRDVTERQWAETALRQAESRLRAVLNNAPITIWAADGDGIFTFSDGRELQAAGLKPAENVGTSALSLYADLSFVDHAGNVSTGREVFRRALAGETVVAVNELNGTFFENYIGPQFGLDGGVVGVVGVATNVAERMEARAAERHSEARFRAIFDRAPLGIALIETVTGRFLAVNPEFARIAGRTVDEVTRLDWMAITHPDDVREDLDNMTLLNAGKISGFQMEKRYLQPGGATIWIMLTVAPMPSDDDAPRHHLAMVEDITERKRSEAMLRQSNDRLQSLSSRLLDIQETERRHLARELHDEIGQALTAAKINLQSLQRYPDPTAVTSRLADSVRIVERALQQVRSLSLSLRPPLLDDLGLAAALRWLVDERARRTGTRVEFQDGVSDSRFDPATEIACFRIAQEALNNVGKHSGARNVAVNLQVQHEALHLRVLDDGAGFDVAAARQRAAGGASLGLLGMEERATLAGGGIEWHSVPGRSTEVHAWFPLHTTSDAGPDAMASA
jgi:PAS domain S-box-containing protein